jgi:hypothetical protein
MASYSATERVTDATWPRGRASRARRRSKGLDCQPWTAPSFPQATHCHSTSLLSSRRTRTKPSHFNRDGRRSVQCTTVSPQRPDGRAVDASTTAATKWPVPFRMSARSPSGPMTSRRSVIHTPGCGSVVAPRRIFLTRKASWRRRRPLVATVVAPSRAIDRRRTMPALAPSSGRAAARRRGGASHGPPDYRRLPAPSLDLGSGQAVSRHTTTDAVDSCQPRW